MHSDPIAKPEPFFTIRQASSLLNVKYHALLRATRKGIVPTYAIGTSRRRVLISEILAAMHSSYKGGAQ